MNTTDLNGDVNMLQGLRNAAARSADPVLPGFDAEVTAPEPPTPGSMLERSDDGSDGDNPLPAGGRVYGVTPLVRVARLLTALGVAACAGIAAIVAYKFIVPRTVTVEVIKKVQVEPDGIPLALLPDSADPALWETVANMHGAVNGVDLSFNRGLAAADGAYWHLVLDFCQSGNTIYAKVAGEGKGTWVVRIDKQGRILKAQPWKHGDKPLKALFAH